MTKQSNQIRLYFSASIFCPPFFNLISIRLQNLRKASKLHFLAMLKMERLNLLETQNAKFFKLKTKNSYKIIKIYNIPIKYGEQ